ncbi:hypothetical protein [Flavobacterium sp.]|uniref:hypothetical protein n=1 Tax=Flavobacterium sp. TaxID=239 RepID=UPI00261C6AC0|nr:hypothetical protein [Flavobacterium sp.]
MAIEWLSVLKSIPELLSGLSGIIKNNRAIKDALVRELRLNIKAFETATKSKKVNYNKLLDLLHNEAIQAARKERFTFNSIKPGKIEEEDIKDNRNLRYIGKDCNWLFRNIDEKIEHLRIQKSYNNSLDDLENTNIALQFTNLLYKLKLLADYIR